MKIAHISDLHAGARDVSPETLRLMFSAVAASGADAVAITGDLTESGTPEEWELLRAGMTLLVTCGLFVLPVPGNHDVAWRGVGQYDDARAEGLDGLAHSWPLKSWPRACGRVLGLNSSLGQRGAAMPFLARGEIGQLQLARLKARGRGAHDVLLLHHHPLWHDALHLLEDAGALNALIGGMGLKLVLCGHQHVYFRRKVGETWFVAAGSTPRERWFEVWEVTAAGHARVKRLAF